MKQILSTVAFSIFLSANLFAQNQILQELIDLPAPPPISKTEKENDGKVVRKEEFYDKKNVPLDDAPIADLIDFWERQNFIEASHPNKIKPSEKTLTRLIETVKEKSENLPRTLNLLLVNEKTSAIVKNIYDTKNGDDFRVLISDEERKAQIEEEISKLDKIDDANEDLDYEIRGKNAGQRRIDRAVEHYEWREFKDGKLGERVDEPLEIPFLRDKMAFPSVDKLKNNDSIGQSKFGNYEIRAGEFSEGGLWKTNLSERIEFKKGVYANPIVSGNWVVAAKAEQDWAAPNNVVRINMRTGKESKINLPPAEEFHPIAVVAALNKVLLYRGKQAYSTLNQTIAEYYLLDANTGKTELIKGEFQPLITNTFRPLQSIGKTNEFWATVYSRAKNETDFGIYNTQDFSFKPLMKLPEILLNSTEVWVDEKSAKIYFIYGDGFGRENHLLSLPLPAAK